MKFVNSLIFPLAIICCYTSCSVSKVYQPDKKYDPAILKEDYSLFRNILEAKHPSLYWYTPKDSMNKYFDEGYKKIADSMTELQFAWNILAPVISNIHCGHTSFNMSKNWYRFIRDKRIPSFPLFLKVWSDSMIVIGNLNKNDSVFKKGTVIKSINGVKNKDLLQQMFKYLPEDGYENNINNLRLSTGFPYYHRGIYGIYKNYLVNYLDSLGNEKRVLLPYYNPAADTLNKKQDSIHKAFLKTLVHKLTRKEHLDQLRSLKIDTPNSTAYLNVYTFSKAQLKPFFRHSFKKLSKNNIQNLVIDIRGNGGGNISNYVSLTRYIRNKKFKVADTAYSKVKTLAPYTSYIKSGFFTNIGLLLFTHKTHGYHFGYWERHTFSPVKRNHFNNNVYVLTNGFTFSASSLFCNAVKGQSNVTLVGENTGGGWYGNDGIFIPEMVLPNTKIRVRLPLFRLVQYDHIAAKGTGVLPDIRVEPTLQSVINNEDLKLNAVKSLIKQNNEKSSLTQLQDVH